jgi:hypothetical protein
MAKTSYLLIQFGRVAGFMMAFLGFILPVVALQQTRDYADLAARRMITPEALGNHLERLTTFTPGHIVVIAAGLALMLTAERFRDRWRQHYTLRDLD